MPSSPRAKKAVAVAAAVADPVVAKAAVAELALAAEASLAKPAAAKRPSAKRASTKPAMETVVAEPIPVPSAAAKPSAAKPGGAKSKVAKSAVAKSAVAEAAVAEPVVAEPSLAKRAVAKSAVAKPAVAKRAGAKSAVAAEEAATATPAKVALAKAAIARAVAAAEAADEPSFIDQSSFADEANFADEPSVAERPSFAEMLLADSLALADSLEDEVDEAEDEVVAAPAPAPERGGPWRLLAGLDRLPPIRLPIGPAIPWRFGLPVLVALLAGMLLLGHPTASAQSQTNSSFRLPADETYPVTQDSPLFPNSQAAPTAQPIGVSDPPGLNVDVVDLTLKLVAVLALAYGSLTVLKRIGVGGGGRIAQGSGAGADGLRVLSSLSLAPNRSIHVVRAPGSKTLLVGATPNQVNLLADLGQVSEADLAEGGSTSFLDVLASKLQR